MRKRNWVLYNFSSGEFHVVYDSRTPLDELCRLDHCVGVYESKELAINRGAFIIKNKIKCLQAVLSSLNSELLKPVEYKPTRVLQHLNKWKGLK